MLLWGLVLAFVGFLFSVVWLLSVKHKKTQTHNTATLRAYGGALQSEPCLHRDAQILTAGFLFVTQGDSQAQPGHQLVSDTNQSSF